MAYKNDCSSHSLTLMSPELNDCLVGTNSNLEPMEIAMVITDQESELFVRNLKANLEELLQVVQEKVRALSVQTVREH